MDSENEQTLHGSGSEAGLGMEPTIQAGVSGTLNQPQGKNLALPNSKDGNIGEVMLRNGKTSGTVSTVPFTQTRS